MWSVPNQVMTMSVSHKSYYGAVGAFVFLTGNIGIVLGQCIITASMNFILMFQGFDVELSEIGKMTGSSEAFIYAWKFTYLLITFFLSGFFSSEFINFSGDTKSNFEFLQNIVLVSGN